MPRYQLRTLLILLALLPPLVGIGWGKYQAWRVEQERERLAQPISWMIPVTTVDPADFSKLPWTVGGLEDMRIRGEVQSYIGLGATPVEPATSP